MRCIDKKTGRIYEVDDADDDMLDIGDDNWVKEDSVLFLTDSEIDAMLTEKFTRFNAVSKRTREQRKELLMQFRLTELKDVIVFAGAMGDGNTKEELIEAILLDVRDAFIDRAIDYRAKHNSLKGFD
jgi:hypothetical protein